METMEFTLSDGTTVTFRKLKMKDLIAVEGVSNKTLKAMKLIAATITAVDGTEKSLTYKDIADWDVGDFQKASDALSEFSGIDLSERDIKKEF